MGVHVSIHDVSPAWTAEVHEALAMCERAGARPALLVVPDFHRKWPLARYPDFCKRLVSLQAEGHEVYLHGYSHLADGAHETSGAKRFFSQRVASGGEAEMADVDPEEGARRLDDGVRILKDAGLRVDGYVAPAWMMPGWLLSMLAARDVRFAETHFHVYDPARGERRVSLVLNWASRSRARMWSTIAFCRIAKGARHVLPSRVAIHPKDLHHAVLRREIERMLADARGTFVPRGTDLLSASSV